MLKICYICLRSRRKLWSLDFSTDLENFYNELVDYGAADPIQNYCSECINKLTKYREFQKCCQLAVQKLRTRMRQPKYARKPISLLHTEMPTSQISFCNNKNLKVYLFESEDLNKPITFPMYTKNIPKERNIEFHIKNEHDYVQLINETSRSHNITDNIKSYYENETFNNYENTEYENDPLITEQDSSLESKSPNKTLKITSVELDEKTKHACKRKLVTNYSGIENVEIQSENTLINLNTLKIKLKEKFENGPINHHRGNNIDIDLVLNNLGKVNYLNAVNEECLGPGPLSKFVIMQLLRVQDDVKYEDVFRTYFLEDLKQIQEQFEKRREFASYKMHKHRCEICISSFKYSKWLDHHIKISHNPDLPFECSICHTRNATKKGINMHIRSHKMVYECKLCNFATGTRDIMVKHYNNHKGNHYKCKYCEAKFINKASSSAHINKLHPNHICQLCASACNTLSGLRLHHGLKHKDEQFVKSEHNKKCEECNVIFISEDIYNEHVNKSCRIRSIGRRRIFKKIQNKEKGGDYLCPLCGIQLKHTDKIEKHMLRHSGSKPFACSKCPKSFYDKYDLRTHMVRHSSPTHECNTCQKKFYSTAILRKHKKIHENDRKYICEICGKAFLLSGSLKEHVTGVHQHIRRTKKPRLKNTQ